MKKIIDLKKIRSELNWTQTELSRFIGISLPTIQRWEAGAKPEGDLICWILDYIDKNINSIKELQLISDKYITVMDLFERNDLE